MSWTSLFHRSPAKRRVKPEERAHWWTRLQADGTAGSLGIAAVFCFLAALIFVLREEAPDLRVHDWVGQDIYSRVDFVYRDAEVLEDARTEARDQTPPIYQPTDVWQTLEQELRDLPDDMKGRKLDQIGTALQAEFSYDTPALKTRLSETAVTAFDQSTNATLRNGYNDGVESFIRTLRPLVVISAEQRSTEMTRQENLRLRPPKIVLKADANQPKQTIELSRAYPQPGNDPDNRLILDVKQTAAASFSSALQNSIAAYTLNKLHQTPTYKLDTDATGQARLQAYQAVSPTVGDQTKSTGSLLVSRGRALSVKDFKLLKLENDAYMSTLSTLAWWRMKIGMVGLVLLVTIALGGYIKSYQPRIVRNHARGLAIALLLLAMLLLAQLAAIGSGPLYLFGIAPTMLVAFILAIAYDKRFAMGVALTHGVLVTTALGQGIGFFLVLFIGILTACYLIDDIRSRSRLIEIGGASALSMMVTTLAVGVTQIHPDQPFTYVGLDVLLVGAAGIAVGFCALGILPFIEKAFRITTGMTLLELADASQPLLRRLSIEAPGTYNHSLQVATLSEAAADAIGANALLCRVGSYYHDVGKINKADYFVENQNDGVNRHINLSPSVSLLIIIGHVKDGIELAREYNLPTVLMQFIQQHHGTTLVEYFYHQAVQKQDQIASDQPQVSETQYRYPGPKPRSRETGIVMLADACESATRAMNDVTPNRIESLVHDIILRRLLDGQLDQCDLTMRDIHGIERALIKTLIGIYHGRVQYPSTTNLTSGISDNTTSEAAAVKTA
ncbi:MAG: HDIG domain-containing protein [Phycisphaerales bacterium]|nr:HDIG domain-containing protein [Phycisphaerales bacterium]